MKGVKRKVYGRSTISLKNGVEKGKGLDLGAKPPRIKLCWVTPAQRGMQVSVFLHAQT